MSDKRIIEVVGAIIRDWERYLVGKCVAKKLKSFLTSLWLFVCIVPMLSIASTDIHIEIVDALNNNGCVSIFSDTWRADEIGCTDVAVLFAVINGFRGAALQHGSHVPRPVWLKIALCVLVVAALVWLAVKAHKEARGRDKRNGKKLARRNRRA